MNIYIIKQCGHVFLITIVYKLLLELGTRTFAGFSIQLSRFLIEPKFIFKYKRNLENLLVVNAYKYFNDFIVYMKLLFK